MKSGTRKLMLCDCERIMKLDAKAIGNALDMSETPEICSHLCRTEVDKFADALNTDEPLLVACTQEAPLFRELAEEAGKPDQVAFTNIRERAGWTTGKGKTAPKIAALIAEACLETAAPGAMPMVSEGLCLVYGAGQQALDVARKLNTRLNVSLMLTDVEGLIPPGVVDVPIYRGKIAGAAGHFGAFEVIVDGYAPAMPSSRSELGFVMPRDGASSTCSVILDLSGTDALFPSHEKRDGYFRVDPSNAVAIAEAMFEISDMAGEFEKPIYVRYDADICAHSRSTQIGCSNCLDICPASAITSAGDGVEIDHAVCGGCGACSSVCPTGAVTYMMPQRDDLTRRVQSLLSTYFGAGGKSPTLLVHDERHGADMIGAISRFGRGLPAETIPVTVNEVTQVGHDWMAVALASGATKITFLADPKKLDEISGLQTQMELITALLDGMGYETENRLRVIDNADPDAVEQALWDETQPAALKPHNFAALAGKRETARIALAALNTVAPYPQEIITLPAGSPYGRMSINAEGCTLCLSCVSACPAGALSDNADKPSVRFVEQACVQCGLCRTTCPESVITLEPRYSFSPEALSPSILHEEEPFDCIKCGKPFGTKSTIERIVAQLAGKHEMFGEEDSQSLIKMCDNCRIEQQATSDNDPFALGGGQPRVVRTEDYQAEEAAVKAGGKPTELTADDFLINDD
ncbi:MAG: 4Fe-4S dicluster domain-containing protein [Alphaproteobacteria bacterium]|nr:4Fe-4S dicluster domain-containing protein [Alphaproteobacteria bacterium]